jgi:hypothetical protein
MQESTITSSIRKPRLNLTRQQTILVGAAAIILLGIAWYLFRPELLFVNRTVNEALPASSMPAASMHDSSPGALASGMFHSVAHETKGKASVYELGGGKHVVRLTGFETSNGPDVHVYLIGAADASDNSTVTQAGYLDLGSLKGNIGDQNYDIPGGTDLTKYHAVTIWCKRFSVNFGTAPLAIKDMKDPAASAMSAPQSLASGMFHKVAHETKGTAAVYELGDGKQVVRLTGFETSNGPDVHVYLVAAADATDNSTVTQAGFLDLGSLKGNIGDQNYDVPAGAELAKYHAVTIWCKRFGVNFATAPLAMK